MDQHAYRRLFKNHSGTIGYWEGWVESPDKVVMQYARTLDGAVTRREFTAKAKNVGRSNETTPFEQAQLELDSRTSKQRDKGYVFTQEEAKAPSTNTLGRAKPMLAQPMDKVKQEDIDWSNAWAQPKLDGHRAMWKDGVLYSRQGKVIDMPHVVEAIQAAGIEHLHLDGELYVHGLTLQAISSLVKRQQRCSLDLTYHIYDVVDDRPWNERKHEVVEALRKQKEQRTLLPGVTWLNYRVVATFETLQELHERNLEEGYEGTMLRWGTAGYQDGKRSKHLVKLKNFQDAEFTIVGVEEGKPYVTETATFHVPVWVLDAGNGRTFTATAQGSMHQKHSLWMTQDQHIGKQLTVKFHYLSKDGIPQLPVALRFREDL